MRAARPKISEIFGRAALACGAVFRVIYLSLAVCAAARRSAWIRDGEPKSFRIYRLAVCIHGDVCTPPSRRANSPREISEAERPRWMRGPRDPKSPEISAVCAAARCRTGAEIQNLSESIRMVVFGHVRS